MPRSEDKRVIKRRKSSFDAGIFNQPEVKLAEGDGTSEENVNEETFGVRFCWERELNCAGVPSVESDCSIEEIRSLTQIIFTQR